MQNDLSSPFKDMPKEQRKQDEVLVAPARAAQSIS